MSYEEYTNDVVDESETNPNSINQNIQVIQGDKPMPVKDRHIMIRGLKLIEMLLGCDCSSEIDNSFWNAWCKASWRLWPDSPEAKDTLVNIINKITTQNCDLITVFVDEMINHNIHCWTALNNEMDSEWKAANFWDCYWNEMWYNKVQFKPFEKCDIKKLQKDKHEILKTKLQNKTILKQIWDWCLFLKYPSKLKKVKQQKLKLQDVKISPLFAVFMYEFTNAIIHQNMCSVIRTPDTSKSTSYNQAKSRSTKNQKIKKHFIYKRRKFQLPKTVLQFMREAYSNKSSCLYWLMYESDNTQSP